MGVASHVAGTGTRRNPLDNAVASPHRPAPSATGTPHLPGPARRPRPQLGAVGGTHPRKLDDVLTPTYPRGGTGNHPHTHPSPRHCAAAPYP